LGVQLNRALRAVVAASIIIVLTACQQSIPREGSVNVGLTDVTTVEQPVIFTPSGPSAGASPEAIVRGFVNAASSAADNYGIARSFLTPTFGAAWNPRAGAIIDEKTRTLSAVGNNRVEITIAPTATVDERGVVTLSPPARNETLSYTLEQVGGEWRIAAAPAGIVLDRATFSLVFNQHTLFFVQPLTQTLVPDVRWFAVGATTATEVVTELLAGPSAQLAGGVVTSGFPDGTVLAADSVPVVDGVARIDLNPQVASVTGAALTQIEKQLSATLRSVEGVTSASLTVEQSPFARIDVQRGQVIDYPEVSPLPVVQLGAELGELSGVTLISLGVWVRAVVAADPSEVIIRDGNRAAVMLSSQGISWVDDQSIVTLIDGRSGLASPTLDRQDFVWSAQTTLPSQVRVRKLGGAPVDLITPWQAADEIVALRISRDGTRLAALVRSGDSTNSRATVQIAGVIRDENATPVALTEAAIVAWPDGEARDIDWLNESQVAVATQPPSGNVRVNGVGLGLFVVEGGTSPDIVTISGANTRAEMRAYSSDGLVKAPQGVTWRKVVNNITLLAKRG
jgi:hypothetical protein